MSESEHPSSSSHSTSSCTTRKKPRPGFWQTLKHPAPSAAPQPLPSLASLAPAEREVYDSLLEALSAPNYMLPMPALEAEQRRLTEAERCFCTRECLLRFCRASRWDRAKALKRIEETLVWRREYGVDEIDYNTIAKEAETGKQFVLGYDVHARPLLHMFPARQNTSPSVAQIKFVVWCLERTIDLMPPGVETLSLLIDFGGPKTGYNGQPTTIGQAREVLKILQTYYCERLAQAICINVPWMFWGFFKLIKPFVDSRTADKLHFDPPMAGLVPAEQLQRECFGGELEFEYSPTTYLPLLIELAAVRREKMLIRYRRFGGGKVGVSEYELKGGGKRARLTRPRAPEQQQRTLEEKAVGVQEVTSRIAALPVGAAEMEESVEFPEDKQEAPAGDVMGLPEVTNETRKSEVGAEKENAPLRSLENAIAADAVPAGKLEQAEAESPVQPLLASSAVEPRPLGAEPVDSPAAQPISILQSVDVPAAQHSPPRFVDSPASQLSTPFHSSEADTRSSSPQSIEMATPPRPHSKGLGRFRKTFSIRRKSKKSAGERLATVAGHELPSERGRLVVDVNQDGNAQADEMSSSRRLSKLLVSQLVGGFHR